MRYWLTGEDPKRAFLFVISHYGAYSHDKLGMLDGIVKKNPSVLSEVSEEEMLNSFKGLLENLEAQREGFTPAEFKWVSKYIKNQEIRLEMERIVFKFFLRSDFHDKWRQEFKWSLTKDEQKNIVTSILHSREMKSNKRKWELSHEFGLPEDAYKGWVLKYLFSLLWNRHYDDAKKLLAKQSVSVVDAEKVVVEVIVENLNNCYVRDCTQLVKEFLPNRQDLLDELDSINNGLNRD